MAQASLIDSVPIQRGDWLFYSDNQGGCGR